MSNLVARLRRRAHLPEFQICGEAADALEAAERERDAANRRFQEIWNERQRGGAGSGFPGPCGVVTPRLFAVTEVVC